MRLVQGVGTWRPKTLLLSLVNLLVGEKERRVLKSFLSVQSLCQSKKVGTTAFFCSTQFHPRFTPNFQMDSISQFTCVFVLLPFIILFVTYSSFDVIFIIRLYFGLGYSQILFYVNIVLNIVNLTSILLNYSMFNIKVVSFFFKFNTIFFFAARSSFLFVVVYEYIVYQ